VYQIPSQFIVRDVDSEYESALHGVPMWPTFYQELTSRIVVRQKGELFLVGAGLFGKYLCIHIKRHGGIAVDIGSQLDKLVGLSTRSRGKAAGAAG
jgi:hypothetical protein